MISNSYVTAIPIINSKIMEENNFSFSPSQYVGLSINNKNIVTVGSFLDRPLIRSDLGSEVGSKNYIKKSTHYFLRTKALQSYSLIPQISEGNSVPIFPQVFVNNNLKEDDLLISKDSNIGEIVILDKDYPNYMTSGALYKLPVSKNKHYLLSFIKHPLFREQLDVLVPKGATIRHAKTLFLNCMIPFPNTNTNESIKYIEALTKLIVDKEKSIKERHRKLLDTVEQELFNNQKAGVYTYNHPTFDELQSVDRLDTNLYCVELKSCEFVIRNYKNGFQSIFDFGFNLSRGQNLQVSNIGRSIYSGVQHEGFYSLMLPKHLSIYGTIIKSEFLGSSKKLKTLNKGDLIFGAEGFEKGRSIVIVEDKEKTITNIHGITITQSKHDVVKAIFIKAFLDYLREKGLIDLYAVGGNGGSLAQKYWKVIPFPLFSQSKQEEISKIYHNDLPYVNSAKTIDDFMSYDKKYNKEAGIYELDKTLRLFQKKLDTAMQSIIDDIPVNIDISII